MERALPERAISNKNVEWLSAPGAWTFVVALIVLSWLLFSLAVDPVRFFLGGLPLSACHAVTKVSRRRTVCTVSDGTGLQRCLRRQSAA